MMRSFDAFSSGRGRRGGRPTSRKRRTLALSLVGAVIALVGCGSSAALTNATTTSTPTIAPTSTTVALTTTTTAPPVETTLRPAVSTTAVPTTAAPVAAAPEQPGPACPNGSYVNSSGNSVCSPYATSTGPPAGATAQCGDGTYSMSQHRSGTCSGHGGVRQWL